jgi:hypothetical protein
VAKTKVATNRIAKELHGNGNAVTRKSTAQEVVIGAPRLQTAEFSIVGTAPYVQNKFSAKARLLLHDKHAAGHQAKKGAKKEPKNFQENYEQASHRSREGWYGIPAPAFRNAMIDGCRLTGFQMTRAKMSVFTVADGFDSDDGTPLVRITKGEPEYTELATRNATGVVDLRARPMWREGWEAVVRIRFDADQFSLDDVANLLLRAGAQVGVGEGRPFSKNSNGMGWGTFEILNDEGRG